MVDFNSAYKSWHKPRKEVLTEAGNLKRGTTHQGYFKPLNPQKYVGDPNLIIYRSGWEKSFCRWCDASPSIIQWSSEPIKIPYLDKVTKLDECKKLGLDPNNPRNWVKKNYNVDFWIKIQKPTGETEKWFIEIKPKSKLSKPIPPKDGSLLKEQKSFVIKAKEYLINEEKYIAADKFAKLNGCKFYIFTEDELRRYGILGGRFE